LSPGLLISTIFRLEQIAYLHVRRSAGTQREMFHGCTTEEILKLSRKTRTHFMFGKMFRTAWMWMAGVPLFLGSSVVAQFPQRPHLVGLSHIAIFAHDYEKSRAFYSDFLGFQEPYSLKNADGTASMTFFKINDHQYIELFPEREVNTDRLNHISLETDDIEALRVYLASKGVKVPSHANRARIGNLSFNITDPAGHTVEMVQYMPDGKTVVNYGKYMSDKRISKHMTHVGLIVTKLDPEYKFYTEILGFKETWRGSSSGKVLSWINLKVPDGDDYVEFMLAKDESDPTHRGVSHHLCLVVPNIAESVGKLKATPYFKSYDHPIEIRTGINRKRQANLFDPDGTRTELMEPTTIDGKPTPPSTAPPPGE
jgi:catechol 2,3-dioxygenase-like lactoylglutathione lyase family enzyme